MTQTYYTTQGDVTGACDHKHRSIKAAVDCVDKHHSGIVRHNTAGAYSDRAVIRTDGHRMDDSELEEMDRWTR